MMNLFFLFSTVMIVTSSANPRMMIPPLHYDNQIAYFSDNESKKLRVDVYYESMCPDSKNFIQNALAAIMPSFASFMSVTLIPFGKAETVQISPQFQFRCQHGPEECEGNLFHNCAQKYISNDVKRVGFVSCLFNDIFNVKMNWQNTAKQCSIREGVESYFASIFNCAIDLEGRQLHHQAGQRTGKKHFIPTVEISIGGRESGKVVLDTRDKVTNLKPMVCDLYLKLHGEPFEPCIYS